ncbi:MAG: hypothetical protein ACK42L_06830, partial [Thermoanaerobaculum sp.]
LVEWINEDQNRLQELAVLLAKAKAAKVNPAALEEAEALYNALLKAKGVHNMDLAAKTAARIRSLLGQAMPTSR